MPTNHKTNSPELLQDARKVAFLDFLAIPRSLRKNDQKDFAREIQVTPQTLSEWKKLPGFTDELTRRIRENAKNDAADVIQALGKRAKSGDPTAIKLWMQYVMGWTEKTVHQVDNPVRIIHVRQAAS